jgi:hypothetical protein
VPGQERQHAARRDQVPGHIAGVPQVTSGARNALHDKIVSWIRTPYRQKRRTGHELFRTVLGFSHCVKLTGKLQVLDDGGEPLRQRDRGFPAQQFFYPLD